jgi:AraC-like DNA-binding protein
MALTIDSLNRLVKEFTGQTPKEYISNRIILEAKRCLFHHNMPIKELAYRLGFSDPDYFSRLFRKKERVSISAFVKKMQNLSS